MIRELVGAYGSFFLLRHPVANLLLVACTLLDPVVGLFGLLGGIAALVARRVLRLPAGLETINGVLAGLFVGSTFAANLGSLGLLLVAAPLVVLLSHTGFRLPLLSGPAFVVSTLALAAGRFLLLPYRIAPPAAFPANEVEAWLQALGSFYGHATVGGGLLLAAALLMSSRWLLMLTVLAFGVSEALMAFYLVPFGSAARLAAGANAALTALMVGGLFTSPSRASLALGAAASAGAAMLSLALGNLLGVAGLPALGLPFLACTWLAMGVLRHGPWERYWLPVPALPEESRQRGRMLAARGLDPTSLPLRAPFFGEWEVYQGFDGPHTHRGPWRHAVDFYRTRNGLSGSGSGERLEDYPCYGAPVVSPAYGTVVEVRTDLPDNPPGEVDVEQRWGNYILIAVGRDEYVMLAHLQPGSIVVRCGMWVVPGQPLGRCGNSGRSPQPHLHMHVQTGRALGSPTRPFHLVAVLLDGQRFAMDARPACGQRVSTPAPNPALQRALHLPVGRRLVFGERAYEVRLDLGGTFWLEGSCGARAAFVETPDLLAFHTRSGGPDPLLDALVLALSLTPWSADASEWKDCPSGAGETWFQRVWDPRRRVWVQRAVQEGRRYESVLCESQGLVELSWEGGSARVEALGLRGDGGVPGWQESLEGLRGA